MAKTIRISYKDYKNDENFRKCKSVPDSYDSRTKTIEIYMLDIYEYVDKYTEARAQADIRTCEHVSRMLYKIKELKSTQKMQLKGTQRVQKTTEIESTNDFIGKKMKNGNFFDGLNELSWFDFSDDDDYMVKQIYKAMLEAAQNYMSDMSIASDGTFKHSYFKLIFENGGKQKEICFNSAVSPRYVEEYLELDKHSCVLEEYDYDIESDTFTLVKKEDA
ncbi:hypothetical protein [Ruminococcus sp. Marseille-P6503]|uniref:hypothetical protein n=1 Tax=Ruminococcus sp. Marseille-P6503 TaxID=2364796 RepID=UPI000F51C622|nr:hypothetical protein [Ruminococcus sp. Marseille-P6503]